MEEKAVDSYQQLQEIVTEFMKNWECDFADSRHIIDHFGEIVDISVKNKPADPVDKNILDIAVNNDGYLRLVENRQSPLLKDPSYRIDCIAPSYDSKAWQDILHIFESFNVAIDWVSTSQFYTAKYSFKPYISIIPPLHSLFYSKMYNSPQRCILLFYQRIDVEETINLFKQLKCESIIIYIDSLKWNQMNQEIKILTDHSDLFNYKIHFIAVVEPSMYCIDQENQTKELYQKMEFDKYPNILDVKVYLYHTSLKYHYNRTEYLDQLNLRRLITHYSKSQNLHHPLLNKDLTKLIESFLY